MNENDLLDVLRDAQISVELDGESLVVKGDKGSVNAKVKSYLAENKASIVDLLKSGLIFDGRSGIQVPRNVIETHSTAITPQMLPLIDLSQADIDRIAAQVPGGVSNIQDIYELTPLQDGILFHHRLAIDGDPYLLNSQIAFPNRARLDQFFSVVQQVIDRHDVLRTSFAWDGLSRPAQIVWRHARLVVVEIMLDPHAGSVADQLTQYCDPRRHRVELTTAPLLSYVIAHDTEHDRWLAIQRFHHLIGDHSTLDLLRSEIYALHAHPEKILAPAEPFRNLVARMRLGPSQDEHEIFFRSMLGDVTEPTLAFGYSDVYLQGDNIDELHRMLPAALNSRLRKQARRLGVSLASLCHLAWGIVLARSIGKEQAVFGTVLLGRMQASDFAKRAAGLFINTVPFRVDLSEKATHLMVSEMHARLSELLLHEHASLALAQRCSGVTGKTPLFNALLNYRHIIDERQAGEGAERDQLFAGVEFLSAHEERTNYPISLSVDDYGHALGLTAHVVRPLAADRLCSYMRQALESLVDALEEAPQTPLRALNVLPENERELLLTAWNATAAPYPQDRCFHELFEEQVRRTPRAIAVIHASSRLSYGELNAQANRLAHHLIGLGVKPDDRVAICVERSAAMVIGLLAILKAGGAYVPLDPAYPSERLSQVMVDAQPLLVLLDAAARAALGDAVLLGRTCIDLESLRTPGTGATAWSSQSDKDPQNLGLTSRHLAYVIYTSGSTGTPKGVQVEHRQLVNFLSAMASTLAIGPSDGWLAVTSIAFDIAGLELYLPLLSGARVVLASYQDTLDPGRLQRLMESHAVRFMQATPATWNAMLGNAWPGDGELVALCGGEAMPAHYRVSFQGRCKSLWNLYGPTETTIWSSCIRVPLEVGNTGSVSIGRPIANTQIYLLDDRRQPVPLGAIGELYIGGAGVARGYLDRPELTAERFVRDPFVTEPAARMYRTGDLARYLPDGNIQYLGRNDFQVKIRGFRIELGEIEARLREHAQVQEAMVDARDAGEEMRLVAYVLPADPAADTGELVATLRVHLATSLPDYMVPAAFVVMAAFPLTPNGKLDRKALPAPDDDSYVRREYEAPQGDVEQALAVLWQELLRIETVGRHDDFFELGGHSLLATRLLARIRQILGVELSVAALFSHSTLAALAQTVASASGGAARAISPMAAISRDEPLPLSFEQQRLWFLAQLDGISETYHIPLALKIRGPLDRVALRQSLNALMARHESLRSVFMLVHGQPKVCLLPEATAFPWIEHDLRGREDALLEVKRVSRAEALASFDLTHGPLVRGRLLQLAENEHVLLLTQHHIVSDGWSIGVVSRELSALYQAFHQGRAHSLPALPIQYPDYAAWQRAWLNGERLERQIAYWRESLQGMPVLLELPTDRLRPLQQDFTGARVPVVLDAGLTQALKRLSQRHGTTLFVTLMTAWAAVLSRLSGQDEVVIGTLIANRGRAETEGLIGFFVNTLALPIHLGGSPSVSELLSRVRTTWLAAQEHQDLPFEQVVEIVQPPRRLNHTPIFQVLFNWQNAEMNLPDFNGLQVELLTTSYERLKFDLELSLSEIGDQIAGTLSYATALFDAATVQRQAGYLRQLLQAMVIDSEQQMAAVDLLPDDEHRLLAGWNATTKPYAQERCIHHLFEDQVRKTSQAPAVIHADQVLSYGELNVQANQLAHHLIGLGVKPDDRVAICVERSTAMVVGLLAILKAGGAYVPLDPTYPSERLSRIVIDAAPSLVLADAAGRSTLLEAKLVGHTVLDLDAHTPAWSSQSPGNPRVPGLTSRHLAYVIYTSGSTGTPKGAMNEHHALINRLSWMQDAYALDGTDVVLQKTSFSFDVSVWEFFWTLSQGAALYVPAPELHKDPPALIELMVRANVTTAHFVPSMLGMFLATAGVKRCLALRRVICSGEALHAIQVQAFLEKLPHAQLHNLYGPTEAAIDVTAWTCPPSFSGNVVPIGRPIANTQIHLLDDRRQPVPLGAIGELYIGGAGVARGYLNRPELTAERFVRDPFAAEPAARMYRTGDLARYLPDGNIEYLGRNDFQVKVRGFRIELGEIEARLGQHAQIREAVVEARGAGDDKRLVAYVLPENEAPDTAELAATLRAYLAMTLPDYMLPSAFVRMAAWPLTPNGKLDRKALPAPVDEAYVRGAYEAPQGEVEQALAALWQELLQVERVGRHDNFFELGGHSLLLVQLIERLRRLHLKADLQQLFATPVLHILAAALEDDRGAAVPANLIMPDSEVITPEMLPLIELNQEDIDQIVKQVPGGVANVQDIYALAPMQDGILFHHRLVEDHDPYLLKTTVSFPNRELMDRFFGAVQGLVNRHDILRTGFIWKGLSTPAQVVWREAALSVIEWELNADAGSAAEQLVRRFDASGHRIDLAKAPLVSFIVAREPESPRWIALQLVHHLIEDAFSMRIFREEIHAILQGNEAVLAPLPPFRNLVARALHGLSPEQHEHFFKKILGDISEPTLPFGLTNVHGSGTHMSEFEQVFPPALTDRLRSQARRLGVGLASLCHLAWGQVLARVVGNECVIFGTVLFGRVQAGDGADSAAGVFINTLPLRLDLGEADVESAAHQTSERLAELLVHEQASLVVAQRSSRVAATTPLFSSLLNYRNVIPTASRSAMEGANSLVDVRWTVGNRYTNYPVLIDLEDSGSTLRCMAHIMQPLSAERVWNYMREALTSLADALEESPKTAIRALNVLPTDERMLLLETWNARVAAHPDERCVHQLFEEQVRKTPRAPAVMHGDRVLNYAEINAQANGLARCLMQRGIRPGEPVVTILERSALLVVAQLAILKAGAVYVPVDPQSPESRQDWIVEDCGASLVLVGAERTAPAGGKTLVLDDGDYSDADAANPGLGLLTAQAAYIMYTSGSTGMPKGVIVPHRAISRLAINNGYADFNADDRVAFASNPAFDASTLEVWAPLLNGGAVVVVDQAVLLAPNRFTRLLLDQAISVLWLTVGLFNQYAADLKDALPQLRYLIVGGDVLDPAVIGWVLRECPPAHLLNGYGPTETTTFATTYEIISVPEGMRRIPIGRPIAQTRIYVLDTQFCPVPMGAVGEIYIGGAGVALGYLNRPELTQERFIPNPFVAGELIYKSGDIGRWLPEGVIEYLGRTDNQVKLRGFRIELGEIEALLGKHPQVRDAVVDARDAGDEKRLVAYVVPTDETTRCGELLATLRAHLAATLPDYMVPAAFVMVDALPLTSNGKLDRKALPTPDDSAYVRHEYEAPRGEVEQVLAGLWQDLLKIERVGRHDGFFDLGGHSLLATRLLVRIRQTLGLELPMASLFTHSTLAGLSQVIMESDGASQAWTPMVTIPRDEPMPLSFAQQRLWFLSQIDGVSATYHIPLALKIRGALDRDALRRSLNALMLRHESLRTVFVAVAGEPQVRLLPATTTLPLVEQDLRAQPDASAELARLGKAEAIEPFDLMRGPLIRGRLIQLANDEHVLLLTQHHIVSDGWSIGVLSRDLGALYQAFQQGQPDALPPLAIQYPDYAAWQRNWLNSERLERQVAYWREALVDAPVLLELPTDRPRPAQQDFTGSHVPVVLDAELTRRLKQLSQQHGTTLFMTIMAAWAAVLSRLSGQEEVVIGTPIANRSREETEELIGFFVNTLALRIDLRASPSVSELLSRVRTISLSAQDHQDLPFEQVVKILQPPRRLNHTPIFQVLFSWQNNEGSLPDLPGVQVGLLATTYSLLKFDLELSLIELDDQIVGSLSYATSLFDAATMERHVGYLQTLLRVMDTDSAQSVANIDLLSTDERTLLLETWNPTEMPYSQNLCIHRLFEEQVRKMPQAPAVVHENNVLSYGELNAQANRLARHLRRMGVGPDVLVGLCVERSAAMIVGLLGVLKAGGAYVPLDPAYPAERLSYALSDSAPVAVIVDGSVRLQESVQDILHTSTTTVLDLHTSADMWAYEDSDNLDDDTIGLHSHHLAYIIYTSGSTGRPKGVMVEHGNVARLLSSTDHWYGFGADDVWTLFHSYAFDFSVWEIWGALAYGGKLVIVPQVATRSPSDFYELLCAQGVTVLNQTPSAFRQLIVAQGNSGQTHRLRYVIFGGEALELSTLKPWYTRSLNHATRLVNMYGITETTVHVTYLPLEPADAYRPGPSPIGRQIPDLQIYVLDAHREPVPLGVPGELYVGGAGVARGYFKRPELTAERFLANPFIDDPKARLYKTGDVGRWLADGSIEYLGRNDEQVKIRGFRIELGEIEARLAEHVQVRETVVEVRGTGDDKRLVAYVLPEDDAISSNELAVMLRAQLAASLPDYMLPSAFVRMTTWPLTPNGKLDRKALLALGDETYVHRGYEAPQGDVEQVLATLWQELLQVERVGRYDNFFELGGHSLLAVQVIERSRQLNLQVDVRRLFTSPVLCELAASLEQDGGFAVPPNLITQDAVAITPEMLPLIDLSQKDIDHIIAQVPGGITNIQDIYALAPLQEGVMFHHMLAEQGDPYINANVLSFSSRESLDRFLGVMQEIVNRHDILRTAFISKDLSKPAQVVIRHAPIRVSDLGRDVRFGFVVDDLSRRYDTRHFRLDLTKAPLSHFVIAEDVSQQRWVLLYLEHHLIGDHVSRNTLMNEMYAIMDGRADTLSPPQPFRNLVAQAWLGKSNDEHERYFRRMLGDITEPTLLFGIDDVYQHDHDVVGSSRVLSHTFNARIRTQARQLGISLASLCHLAWGQMLARIGGTDHVVFGTVLFGRMEASAIDQSVGLFINTLPLRLDLGDIDVVSAARQAHMRLAELLQHEHASLVLAQRCNALASAGPLFNALINYRHSTADAIVADSTNGSQAFEGIELIGSMERDNYPISLSVDDYGNGLGITAQIVMPLSAERLCDYMQLSMESLVDALESSPGTMMRALEVLPAEERTLLLETWNTTDAPQVNGRCIHQLFEQQVHKTPDATAVIYENRAHSYGELNAQANRLAHYLISLGVRPDDRVALCVQRSAAMVIGLLAILKAGGAYLPLDPAYPSKRLEEVLDDASPRIVLGDTVGRSALGNLALKDRELVDLQPLHACGTKATAWESKAVDDPHVDGLTSEHLAYVIYTSGSTGKPKGVMVEHGHLVNYTIGAIELFQLSYSDTVLQQNTMNFDLSVEEIFPALMSGASLAISTEVFGADTEGLSSLQPSFIHFTAAHWNNMVSAWSRSPDLAHKQLDGVRLINVTGDAVSSRKLQMWDEVRPGHVRLVNTYGPTEATVSCTAAYLRHDPAAVDSAPTIATIGRPMAGARIYLLGPDGQIAPLGGIGELYVGGAGVARGYLNRPNLTEERFLPDPFSSVSGARMYRTGDLARYLPDGNLEFLGRNDQQTKIRGFRIEPSEIEARLIEQPGVREAVVNAREDTPGDKQLIAYIVLDPGSPNEILTSLRESLVALLPNYMVPAAFVQLESLPLTANGKLDRKALPAPDGAVSRQRTSEAPQGQTEEALADLWRDLLGIEQVGRHDSFFDLGGHSLLAMNLIMRTRKLFDCNIALRDLFSGPTLSEFALLINGGQAEDANTNLIVIRPGGAQLPLFFVHAGGGSVSYAKDLAIDIDPAIPIYGLQATGLAVGEQPLTTVAQMAERYIESIRRVQAKGPYRLAGWSDGGVIAYEMAKDLVEIGESVEFVGLIDTFHPIDQGLPTKDTFDEIAELLEILSFRSKEDEFEKIQALADGCDFPQLVEKIYVCGLVPKEMASLPVFDPDIVRAMMATRYATGVAVRTHLSTPLPIPVWLFEAQESELLFSSPTWRSVLSDHLRVIPVSGDHFQLMLDEDKRRELGTAISEILKVPIQGGG